MGLFRSTMKKIYFYLILNLIFLFGIVHFVYASDIVTNGGFENWTGNVPDDWPIIDGGIELSLESTIVHGGSKSAKINVITKTQASTDFRQNVSVTSGEEYSVSVWIYHTEGNVKARLYANNDYQDYSYNTITGSWLSSHNSIIKSFNSLQSRPSILDGIRK